MCYRFITALFSLMTMLFVITPASANTQIDCRVKIFQDGLEVLPAMVENISTYKLNAKEFKVEVSPNSCNPSMSLVTKHEITYLTQTPLVFATSGYWVAGDTATADMLTVASIGGNPRTSLDEEIDMATHESEWAKTRYKELCDSLAYCPTPAKTYATAWPFLNPESLKNRGYAEFKRFDKFSPMSRASGRLIYAVIYTVQKTIIHDALPIFYVLKPNVISLNFRQNEPLNRAQSVINAFQVMCTLELPNFEHLDAKATAMQMKIQADKKVASPGNITNRSKAWIGGLTDGPFVLLIEEMTGPKGKATSCAVAGDVPDADSFRSDAFNTMRLPIMQLPEISSDGSRSYIWQGKYGPGTTLILRDYKPSGKSGIMLKLLNMEERR